MAASNPSATHVTEEEAVQAYHDYIVQYFQDMAEKSGSDFSMGALQQPPRNSAQQETYNDFLQLLVENIEYLIANNIVLVPGSEAFNNINPAPFSIDNGNAHIYFLLELLKIGHTGEGLERLKEYIKQLREEGIIGPNDTPTIFSCIDVENIPVEVQRESAKRHLEGLKRFLPDELPTTEYESLLLQMLGLPIPAIYYIWSVVKSVDECLIYGGGIEIQSFWRRFELNAWESGLQEYLRGRGVAIHQGSIMHEFVNGNFLGCYLFHRLHTKKDVDAFLKKFPSHIQDLIRRTVIAALGVSTWPPGSFGLSRYRSSAEKGLSGSKTQFVLDYLFGADSWCASTTKTPLDFVPAGEEPSVRFNYASYLYPVPHRWGMLGVKIGCLQGMVTHGGFVFLDENIYQ
jgi:hypothetical protein